MFYKLEWNEFAVTLLSFKCWHEILYKSLRLFLHLDLNENCSWMNIGWSSLHRFKDWIGPSALLRGQQLMCMKVHFSMCAQLAKYLLLLEVRQQSLWEDLDVVTFFYYHTMRIQIPPLTWAGLLNMSDCVQLIEDSTLLNGHYLPLWWLKHF